MDRGIYDAVESVSAALLIAASTYEGAICFILILKIYLFKFNENFFH
jgi:hypothetical protein